MNKFLIGLVVSAALILTPTAEAFKVGGMTWVTVDGSTGQAMVTDGHANLGWATFTAPTFFHASSPLVFTQGTGTFSIPAGNSTTNGYLSSGDWINFNNRITGLTSDVSATGPTGGTGPSNVAATVNAVGGSTAANVHSAELLANAAVSANTVSTIVKRDSSGNFSAGTISAALTGIASGNTTITPAEHGVVISSATNVLSTTAVGLNGQIFAGATGTDPAFTYTPSIGSVGHAGSLLFNGSTSGVITFQTQNAAGTYNFNLPTSAGSLGQPLLSGGGSGTAMTFGTLGATYGGTGQNFSASTGSVRVVSGTMSANTETGTGNSVLSASPTLTGTVAGASETLSGTLVVGNTVSAVEKLDVYQAVDIATNIATDTFLADSTAFAAGVGGVSSFGGKINAGGSYSVLAGVGAAKATATTDETGGDLVLYSRVNGEGRLRERMRAHSAGNVSIGTSSIGVQTAYEGLSNRYTTTTDQGSSMQALVSEIAINTNTPIINNTSSIRGRVVRTITADTHDTSYTRAITGSIEIVNGSNHYQGDNVLTSFYSHQPIVGAGVVTADYAHFYADTDSYTLTGRKMGLFLPGISGGTYQAYIADNRAFTSDYFISQTSSLPSSFGGAIAIAGTTRIGGTTLSPFSATTKLGTVVDGGANTLTVASYGGVGVGGSPTIRMYGAQGTEALPTATQANDGLGGFFGHGHDGTVFTAGSKASVRFVSGGNWTPSSNPVIMTFFTTPSGSATSTERMRINASGEVGIGMTAVNTLDVAGTFGTTGNAAIGGTANITGTAAVGGTVSAARGLNLTTALTGTTQTGLFSAPTFDTTATVAAKSMLAITSLPAGSYTTTDLVNIDSFAPAVGVGVTATNFYGIRLPSTTAVSGTITNRYGIFQADTLSTNQLAGPMVFTNTMAVTGKSTLTGGIVGSDGTAAATTGNVGEIISANSPTGGSGTIGSSTAYSNVASISLTAGDWDVEGDTLLSTGATTVATSFTTAISTSSAALDAANSGGVNILTNSFPVNGTFFLPTGVRRIRVSATTTVYLVGNLTYTTAGGASYSTNSFISARRVR